MGHLKHRVALCLCVPALVVGPLVFRERPPLPPHGSEARNVQPVPWTWPNFTRVLGANRSELGLPGSRDPIELRTVGGRSCVTGPLIAFDVDDAYAFDIDEPVDLTLTYALEFSGTFAVAWDSNGGAGFARSEDVQPSAGAELREVTLTLDRARFSGHGVAGTDIAVGGRGGVTLCDVSLERSGTTRIPTDFGELQLRIRDAASGRTVPARVGLYDATGRAPLPTDQALTVHRFVDEIQLLWVHPRTFWPSENRLAFYVDGSYEAQLPVGTYELVVTRGPEYRAHTERFEVRRGAAATVEVALERYADLPAQGWYSGDSHIHLMRDRPDDPDVWGQVAAEDIHVGHLLEMGNIAGTHFKQPAWGRAGRYERDGHIIMSGQEDPRTGHRGHTIHWNISRPTHEADDFFQYHRVFEESRRQGGLTGYAHLGQLFNGQRGLALDVPLGLVDFIEVLQGGRINTEIWYRFLNLGYKVLPVAGADFPYFGPTLPGVERTYVKLDGPLTADSWLSGFRSGRVYVTNGAFLELTVNGREMGEEMRVERGTTLEVVAEARLNPDLGRLDRVELVVHGEVVATERAGSGDRIQLRAELTADHSLWLAVRAWGEPSAPRSTNIAHSAPVYVRVGDEPFWKADAVPELVEYQRQQLQSLLTTPIDPEQDLEPWETREALLEQWERQRPLVEPRIAEAAARYQALLEQLRTGRD